MQFFNHQQEQVREVRRVTVAGMLVNIALSIIKFIVGVLGSSQAMIADAVHSLSDLTTDVAILIGSAYWAAPPDENHPYGHARYETMISTAIGLMLAAVGTGIGLKALHSIRCGNMSQPGSIALLGALISIIGKESLYRWTLKVAKDIKSSAVAANAWHHRTDAISSIPVAIAVCVAVINPRWAIIDQIGAVAVSIFILIAAWRIIKPSLQELTESGAQSLVKDTIKMLALDIEDVISAHAIRTRRLGQGVFVDLHITVNGSMSVKEGHDISTSVKHTIIDGIDEVVDVVVHLEPDEGNRHK